ncbi:prolipoprotein diacylglyceryl transferase [candidate division WWE3 bacterium RIFOXYD1_FULL_43_17]|uniref:Phosphatidylglycerol--prolipoprotein diacylglyceryl transferase n=3 Tax=Katanobacteria TaxID=422282 RepID=A0A1F4XGW9_UNCKA|nr:MAG: Prolipoprotein diacylglyceryl transferase [candidate division WWE3 bacterium GW2011_GWE1_41_27]KKS60265.1 MAG: Prolipoprotein diacylglyceryl transferase [candidate division WWE3 bacterium GW2011_GWF2_42_42]OGC80939.1 MAG: prolipoprotein diacylglyceryl transferase [candidate division WWE3 bacterium RIFOXYD1_FULL_43_17]
MSIYGLLISISILACLSAAEKIFPSKKKEIWDMGLYAVVAGIIGARLYHVIDYWQYYTSDPLQVFKLWNGGLGIWGAIIGGIIGVGIYSWTRRKTFPESADMAATVLPLGQAIGRWGNFFNSELSGKETTLPWAVQGRHPIFLYESLLDLLLFFFLVSTAKKERIPGFLLSIYLFGYGVIRFVLEFLRVGPWKVGALNVAQMVSILSIVMSLIIYIKGRRA